MDTYEGSIYDPDTLHKYLYANGNPVTYSDPSGNMFDLSSTAMGMGIQNVLNSAVQISYRGVMCGLTNMTLTAVMRGSWEQAKSSFVTGFILGAGISVVRYFVVGAKLVTLARFYVLSASANFIFSATMTIFAVTKGYSELAVMSGVMVVLSIAEWCWAYGNYLQIDVYGNNGSATIECNPGGSETKDIYMAVGADEYEDIMRTGKFRGIKGKTLATKEFGNDFNETLEFANRSLNKDKVAIIKVTIPQHVYDKLSHMNLDVSIFTSGTPVVEPDVLDFFNNNIINIEHVY